MNLAMPPRTVARFDPMPYEVDFTGFLNNTTASRWMETLRVRLMREQVELAPMCAPSAVPVIARCEIEYRAPIRFGDQVQGSAWIEQISSSRWQVAFEFINETLGRTCITARQTAACIDPLTHRPLRMPRPRVPATPQTEGTRP